VFRVKCRPNKKPTEAGTENSTSGIKRQRREAVHTPLTSAELNECWYTSTPPNVLIRSCLINYVQNSLKFAECAILRTPLQANRRKHFTCCSLRERRAGQHGHSPSVTPGRHRLRISAGSRSKCFLGFFSTLTISLPTPSMISG
jgi:hypothetical protein